MALSHRELGETAQACEDFDRSLQAYQENMRRNPNAKPSIPARFNNLPEALAAVKQQSGCPQ
jgi:hypothetical protein